MLDGVLDQLRVGLHLDLFHHAVFVKFHGARGDLENPSDLPGRASLGDELQHLALPRSQVHILARLLTLPEDRLPRNDRRQIGAPLQGLPDRLEANVRSSSPLESTNSLIRDHLNTCRGQIDQKMLDLIVYSINHKIANRGPYQGTSRWQRLTGKSETTDYAEQILKFAAASDKVDEIAA